MSLDEVPSVTSRHINGLNFGGEKKTVHWNSNTAIAVHSLTSERQKTTGCGEITQINIPQCCMPVSFITSHINTTLQLIYKKHKLFTVDTYSHVFFTLFSEKCQDNQTSLCAHFCHPTTEQCFSYLVPVLFVSLAGNAIRIPVLVLDLADAEEGGWRWLLGTTQRKLNVWKEFQILQQSFDTEGSWSWDIRRKCDKVPWKQIHRINNNTH